MHDQEMQQKKAMKALVQHSLEHSFDGGVLNTSKQTWDETPLIRFRRLARAVMLLIQVCNVCKEIVTKAVNKEPWFTLLDNIVANNNIRQKRKGPRAFVTFVPNEKRQLVQLTFDLTEFKREYRTEYIFTSEVKEILSILPGNRCVNNLSPVIRCMKGMFEKFSNYSLPIQKEICQRGFYDKYRHNRVVVKKGQNPDGIYFVLSGTLIEKHEVGRQPKEIYAGSMFGEYDLICGSNRRHTVITRTETELLYLHKQDYRQIFNMAEDSNDPRNLNICKQHAVFQHFPMFRLTENPGTWGVLSYKYGSLIARDNNSLDWIYVIKSGEARVYKYLDPGDVNIKARRKKVQAMVYQQSPFYHKQKIFDFVEEREYIHSSYNQRLYKPRTRTIMSAPITKTRDRHMNKTPERRQISTCIPGIRAKTSTSRIPSNSRSSESFPSLNSLQSFSKLDKQSLHKNTNNSNSQLPNIRNSSDAPDFDSTEEKEITFNTEPENIVENISPVKQSVARVVIETVDDLDLCNKSEQIHATAEKSSESTLKLGSNTLVDGDSRSKYIKTPSIQKPSRLKDKRIASVQTPSQAAPKVIQIGNHTLPAFVQVETLYPGDVFGLRACLDHDEKGPSASLVSAECDVLQINKEFFMKHCDDALFSLIRLKAKAFPTREDLIDRLDVNMQWEEFKQKIVSDVIKHRGKK